MKNQTPWVDPDHKEPEQPDFNFFERAGFYSGLVVAISTLILFGLQLNHLFAYKVALMSWWWVVSPVLIIGGLWVIGLLIVVSLFVSAIISDIRNS